MENRKKIISIMTACYNEEENVEELARQVKIICNRLPDYQFEHVFIDNSSTDRTVEILKRMASADRSIKIIVNTRNFGHIRSPFHGLIQCNGDAIISVVADFQDPPEMIIDFVKKWEEGYKIVIGIKIKSKENWILVSVKKLFYKILEKISDAEQIRDFTGFGLYDKHFVDVLRKIDDPYPYFRGLISDMGYGRTEIPYFYPKRNKGRTKNGFYSLYDMAMLGFVNHSKVPLRLASFVGFGVSLISILVGLGYLFWKLFDWHGFQLGMAPLITGIFFLGGVQLFFLGIIGEYIGAIFTQVKKRPLVIEKERINFD